MATQEFLNKCKTYLAKIREDELPRVTDPYQKIMANCNLIETMVYIEEVQAKIGSLPNATHQDFQDTPPQKSAATEPPKEDVVKDLNPQAPLAEKVMDKLTEVQNATTVEALKTPINNDAVPEDWADRTLKMEELDATWTNKLLQNKEYQNLYTQLVNFFITGIQRKMVTVEWIDQMLNKFTDGRVKKFVQPKSMGVEDVRTAMNQIPPQIAQFILNTMKQAYVESINNKQ